MHRFEYRVETIDFKRGKSKDVQLCEALNKWGKQGWRACHIEFRPLMQAEETGAQIVLERNLGSWLLSEEDD